MPSIFTLIGNAWSFWRSQPVLNTVMFWMIFLPFLVLDIFIMTIETLTVTEPAAVAGLVFAAIGFVVLILACNSWGEACVLSVARKWIEGKAGRPTTSFSSLSQSTQKIVFPLLLTGLLYECYTFFWALLLIIPGIIYSVRAVFYPMVALYEDRYYGDGLRRSIELVRGRTWSIFLYQLGFAVLLIVPVLIFDGIGMTLIEEAALHPGYTLAFRAAIALVYASMHLLMLLGMAQLYQHVRSLPPATQTHQLA